MELLGEIINKQVCSFDSLL